MSTNMNINWYPGHMKKTGDMIKENLKAVDLAVEVIDGRIPLSSSNPMVRKLTEGKPRITVINKVDLADPDATEIWLKYFKEQGTEAVAVNAMTGEGVNSFLTRGAKLADASGRAKNRPGRMMITGVPNSGKSSLINRLAGRKGARVGDRPGVTTGKQWLKIKNGMELLDTPGILWPKFEDPKTGLYLAFCGAVKEEILDVETLALEFIKVMDREYRELLFDRYSIGEGDIDEGDSEEFDSDGHPLVKDRSLAIMEAIARARGFVMSGGRSDYTRTARTLMDEFRHGKIGRITLELPE